MVRERWLADQIVVWGPGLARTRMAHSRWQPRKEPKVALYISGKVTSLAVQLGLMFDL